MRLFKSFLLAIFAVLFLSRCGGSDGAGTSAEAGAGSGKIESQNKKTSWNGDADVGQVAACIVGDYQTEDKVDPEFWGWTSSDEKVPITIHVRANNAKGSLLFVAREKEGSNRSFCTEFSNIGGILSSTFGASVIFLQGGMVRESFGAIGDADIGFSKDLRISGVKFGEENQQEAKSVKGKIINGVINGVISGDDEVKTVNCADDVKLELREETRGGLDSFSAKKVESVSGSYESLLNDCKNSKKEE